MTPGPAAAPGTEPYVLDQQIGFVLRQVSQRHGVLFAAAIGSDITPTQWAALARLYQVGPLSQNLLGRQTAMDAATVKGVVNRLARRGLVATEPNPEDGRRLTVVLTHSGRTLVDELLPNARRVTEQTLAGLSLRERETLLGLLARMR